MKKIIFLLLISLVVSSCSFIGSIGYWLKEQDFIVTNPKYQSFHWIKKEHPKALSLYEFAQDIDGLSSFLIVKHETLIAEWYAPGFHKEKAVNIKSVSKSILSSLVGIAIHKGYLKSIDQPVIELIPEYFPTHPQEKKKITIKHLLTMSAGFEYRENQDNYVYSNDNWTKSILELPLVDIPGKVFRYGTIQSHLLSAILTKVTGMTTLEFAQHYLFNTLQISIRRWKRSPDGIFFGGSQMYITPRDMAAFGQLYLKNGKFSDQQIVPPEWINLSINPAFRFVRENTHYGYAWWITKIANHNVYYAEGYGNQIIMNVPDSKAIIVFTADTPFFYNFEERQKQIWSFLKNKVFPVIES